MWHVFIAFIALLVSFSASSQDQVDLFNSEILVINQSAEVRKEASKNALGDIFVRLSGTTSVLQNPAIKSALNNASQYVYEYGYQSTDKTLTIAGTEYPANRLQLKFTPEPLEGLLRENQLPIWLGSRPSVLTWIVVNNSRQNYLSASRSLGKRYRASANKRGIPILLPILDLEDRNALPISRLSAMDEGRVRVASQRYPHDAILAGRIDARGNKSSGTFRVFHQGQEHYFTAEAKTTSRLMDTIVDELAQLFADKYAVVSANSQQELILNIQNIQTFADYTQVMSYLENLTITDQVQLQSVDAETLEFKIMLAGREEQLLNILSLDNRLKYIESVEQPLPEISISLSSDETTINESEPVFRQLNFEWL